MIDFFSQKLNKYYIDRSRAFNLPKTNTRSIDEKGVLLNKIPYTQKWDYYPCDICHYALGNFEKYIETHENSYKETFLKQADWLLNNSKINNGSAVWEHDFTLPFYKFNRVPWVHGMAQGLAMSALLRAFQITNNNAYLDNAKKAFNAFEKDINEGGVKYIDEDGDVWLEEYAILPPPHILNGFIFALFGIYDLYRVTKKNNVYNLWIKAIGTLEKNMAKFDTGYWSRYNLLQKYPATLNYHILHVKQLNVLYYLTKKDFLKNYAKKWETYMDKKANFLYVKYSRAIIHLKRIGPIKCIKQYRMRKEWIG